MSKKMMLLALALAAMFALPSAASATEDHITGITTFTGSGGLGTLTAKEEPVVKCGKTAVTAGSQFNSGSSTTGVLVLDFTECNAEFLGIKAKCNTAGAAAETIAAKGAFHVITVNNKPGILVTPETTTILCAGFSRFEVTGNIIGTITSPACGVSSNSLVVNFESEGSTQKDQEYTGVKYDLTVHTENEKGETTVFNKTAAINSTVTLNSATAGTIDCT